MVRLTLLFAFAFALTGCADHITFKQAMTHEAVGFWYGLWHATILPFAWFISLFDESVAIYAIYNNGGWYDFGFAVGVTALVVASKEAS